MVSNIVSYIVSCICQNIISSNFVKNVQGNGYDTKTSGGRAPGLGAGGGDDDDLPGVGVRHRVGEGVDEPEVDLARVPRHRQLRRAAPWGRGVAAQPSEGVT